MRYYRRGAIRFLKLGRFGISWWWAKPRPKVELPTFEEFVRVP